MGWYSVKQAIKSNDAERLKQELKQEIQPDRTLWIAIEILKDNENLTNSDIQFLFAEGYILTFNLTGVRIQKLK